MQDVLLDCINEGNKNEWNFVRAHKGNSGLLQVENILSDIVSVCHIITTVRIETISEVSILPDCLHLQYLLSPDQNLVSQNTVPTVSGIFIEQWKTQPTGMPDESSEDTPSLIDTGNPYGPVRPISRDWLTEIMPQSVSWTSQLEAQDQF